MDFMFFGKTLDFIEYVGEDLDWQIVNQIYRNLESLEISPQSLQTNRDLSKSKFQGFSKSLNPKRPTTKLQRVKEFLILTSPLWPFWRADNYPP